MRTKSTGRVYPFLPVKNTIFSRCWKRCKTEGKLVLNTNRKSYMSFRLVPKSVTLNDLIRRNGRYIALLLNLVNLFSKK